jgi:hypothetical protein
MSETTAQSTLNGASVLVDLHVMDPTATRYGTDVAPLAARPASLQGLRLGLLWNAKPNGDAALRAVGEQLASEYGMTVTFHSGSLPCERDLLATAAETSDVVVACTADCGSCTSWITHDCVQLERAGVPCVIIASSGFSDDVETSARAFGMAGVQYVEVPKVYNNLSAEESRAQTLPVVREIVKLLTSGSQTLSPDEQPKGDRLLRYSGTSELGAFAGFNADFLSRDWGDGYPLLPPAANVVAELVEGVDGEREDLICLLPPGNGYATVEQVAVNAAMAGCRPSEMPVVMAALRALANVPPPWNLMALMSTSAHAPMFIVNGPIGRELGINGGRGCIGPGKQNEVNLRIGRAIYLCLKNLGCWYHGVMDLDTLGTTRKFISVIAENEEESPWLPFHVQHGYDSADSTITVLFTTGDWDIGFQGHTDPIQLAHAIASNISGLGYGHAFTTFVGGVEGTDEGRLVIVPPPHALPLAEGGFTKASFARFLHQHVREPVSRMIEASRRLHADGKGRPEYEWMFQLPDHEARATTIPALERPDLFHVIVAGSVRAKDMVLPTATVPVIEAITSRPGGRPS